jgi:hypothetical protein
MKVSINGIDVVGSSGVRMEDGSAHILDSQGNETGIVIKNVWSIELEDVESQG